MNCFPKNNKIKFSNKFEKFLNKNKLNQKKIICHLGSIGPDHYLEEIIKSIKFVKKICLVIGGNSIGSYSSKLKNIIFKLKLMDKVFILEDISNKLWFEILKNLILDFVSINPQP